jgi:DNA polymerase III delta prime subunit
MSTIKKSPTRLNILDLSHHAYYLIGDDSTRDELIVELNKRHKIQVHGNADFSNRKHEIFTIDDARELKSNAGTRPVGTSKKIFVIQMSGITVEAQNALLKLLEEPADYVHFFLIIPSPHLLLPTVKSRMNLIKSKTLAAGADVDRGNIFNEAESFLKMSVPKRFDHIKKLVDDISKEKKVKQDVVEFLNAIEEIIYDQGGVKKSSEMFAAIEKARSYMNDRAPSVKMLLEYVALNI